MPVNKMNSDNIWYEGNSYPSHPPPSYVSATMRPDNNIDLQRQQFVKKVYDCLSYQFMATAVVVGFVYCSLPLQFWLLQNSGFVLGMVLLLTFVPQIVLHISKHHAQIYPNNYLLLGAFTLGISLSLSFSLIYVSPAIIFEATIMTTVTSMALSYYAQKTSVKSSSYELFLFPILISLIFGGFLNILLASPILDFMLSVVGVGVFSLYIVYDTQELTQKSNEFGDDKVILTTMNLYLDVVNLFIKIVKILNELSGDDKDSRKKKY
jgi:protein lifeguard